MPQPCLPKSQNPLPTQIAPLTTHNARTHNYTWFLPSWIFTGHTEPCMGTLPPDQRKQTHQLTEHYTGTPLPGQRKRIHHHWSLPPLPHLPPQDRGNPLHLTTLTTSQLATHQLPAARLRARVQHPPPSPKNATLHHRTPPLAQSHQHSFKHAPPALA